MRTDPPLRTGASAAEDSSDIAPNQRARRGALPLAIAILTVEGWDLGALGTSGPKMLATHHWGATTATLGMLGVTLSLGMPIGALLAGRATDKWGRRRPLVAGLALATIGMAISGLAPSLKMFTLGLGTTGVAVGALTILTVAFVADYAPPHRHSLHLGAAQCGVALGGLIVPFAGRVLLDRTSFQSLFLIGILTVCLIPACLFVLPRTDPAIAPAMHAPLRALREPRFLTPAALFAVTSMFVMTLVAGTAVWLPTLLVGRGFDLHSALGFTVAFNGGAIVGTLAATVFADRGAIKGTTLVCLAAACVALLALSAVGVSWMILAMAALAGAGTYGSQNLLNSFIAASFPNELRGTALGTTIGIGRIGAVVGPGYVSAVAGAFVNPAAGFYALMIPAVCGAGVLALVHAAKRPH